MGLEEGQIWQFNNGIRYRISRVRGEICTITNVADNCDISNSYRTNNFHSAAWKLVQAPEKKIAESYITTYCSDGCGTVKIICPGEQIEPFRCKTCSSLSTPRRRRREF